MLEKIILVLVLPFIDLCKNRIRIRVVPVSLLLASIIVLTIPGFLHAQLVFTCKQVDTENSILDLRDPKIKPCGSGFCADDDKRFADAVKTCGRHRSILRVELTSGGGDLDAGIKIAHKMREFGLHAHVPEGSRCISSCTIAFLGGIRRTVDPDGTYEVHGFFGSSRASSSITYLKENFSEFHTNWNSTTKEKQDAISKDLENLLKPDFVEITRSTVQFTRRVMLFLQQNRVTLKLLDSIFEPVQSSPLQTKPELTLECSPVNPTKEPAGPADFILNGVIRVDDVRKFKKSLKECSSKQEFIQKIEINSPGGAIDVAFEMADLIKKYGFASSVPRSGRCEGACGLLFLAGFPRFGKSINIGTQWLGEHIIIEGTDYLRVQIGQTMGFIENKTRRLNITNLGSCVNLLVKKGNRIRKSCVSLNRENLKESIPFEGGFLKGLSKHYYKASDGYNSKVPIEEQPLSIQLTFKILDYMESIFPNLITKLIKTNPKQFFQLLKGLAQHESEKIIDLQRGQAFTARRLFNLIRASRVSSKFMDHMFATGITGLRPLTPEELRELAIITDTRAVKVF